VLYQIPIYKLQLLRRAAVELGAQTPETRKAAGGSKTRFLSMRLLAFWESLKVPDQVNIPPLRDFNQLILRRS
jgi:hypothetical protein